MYKEKGATPPLQLVWHWRSRRYGWPWPDGWRNWPAYHFTRIREAAAVEAAIEGYGDAKDKITWGEQNPDLLRLFYRLQKLR